MKPGRRTAENGRGVAAVEFALLLPILILFILGIVEFGRGYNAKTTLTHAAREGVRELAIDSSDAAALAAAEAVAEASAAHVDSSTPPTATATENCGASPPTVTMTVDYTFSYDILFFGSANVAMSESATMRCGG